jgi:hypothetical protein
MPARVFLTFTVLQRPSAYLFVGCVSDFHLSRSADDEIVALNCLDRNDSLVLRINDDQRAVLHGGC